MQQPPLDLQHVPAQRFWAVMECMDSYLAAQEELAAALKAGLFDLAKAKYSLGPGALGQQHYPGDMTAAATVVPQQQQRQQQQQDEAQEEDDSLYDTFELRQQQLQQQQCRVSKAAATAEQQPDDNAVAGNSRAAPRDGNSSIDRGAPHTAVDPVRWFSPLPPPPLKSAQAHFGVALQHAVAAANKVQELRQLLEELLEQHADGGAEAAAEAGGSR
jgi:hypothetical protein